MIALELFYEHMRQIFYFPEFDFAQTEVFKPSYFSKDMQMTRTAFNDC